MVVHEIKSQAEFDAMIKAHKYVVVDSYATWCGPCRVIGPVFEKFSENYPQIYFAKFDTDEVQSLSEHLKIRAMPTFTFFHDGNKLDQVTGASPDKLENTIKTIFGNLES
ncbi:putative thioredoxin [Erysiphe necator]|uniref:Thioredoxin n=1 Tax=Uncinula necator TaxID=52586 RepID=A0A0B1PAA1_UNCNE|nr:putative thioredoxin [Erysiphe necator]